jgi:HK97 gp10 family phage protein
MSAGISFNVGAINAAIDAVIARVAAANEAGAVAGGLIFEREIKRQIQGGHPKGTKTGATPGGPPQNITGNLRRSVTVSPPQGSGLRVSVDIGPSASYGGFVNDGTPRMPAYPYVPPAVKIAEPQAHAVIVSAWARAIS